MPSTGSPQRRVVKKLHRDRRVAVVAFVFPFFHRGPFPGIVRRQLWPAPHVQPFRFFLLGSTVPPGVPIDAQFRRLFQPGRSARPKGVRQYSRHAHPAALARILHCGEAIRISLEPLNAADQPGQITEVFTQCATLLNDRMCPVMMDSHMILEWLSMEWQPHFDGGNTGRDGIFSRMGGRKEG